MKLFEKRKLRRKVKKLFKIRCDNDIALLAAQLIVSPGVLQYRARINELYEQHFGDPKEVIQQ